MIAQAMSTAHATSTYRGVADPNLHDPEYGHHARRQHEPDDEKPPDRLDQVSSSQRR